MKSVCANEQDSIIKIKVKLLEKVKKLGGKERRKQAAKIFDLFDNLPDFKNIKLVDVKCKKCTYPDCDHAQSMVDLLDEISTAKAEDVTTQAERNQYIKKLFRKKCAP
ncbi:MAG: hypothetical protein HQL72_11820 [Magnetococcales bacterium]|nr:hypothetical protein [Magnetococcales bacterium]